MTEARHWFPGPPTPDDADLVVFCLPAAGGGATSYSAWRTLLPDSLRPQPIQLPGRENRVAEPPAFDVATVADALRVRIDRPYVLYGHSMGAVLAVELAGELVRLRLRPPERLYLAASCPPHVRAPWLVRWRGLTDDELLTEVGRLHGLPAPVLAAPQHRARLISVLRSDLDWLAARTGSTPQPVGSIVTIAGEDDVICPARLQTSWSGYSTTPLCAVEVPGGHLFHMSNAREVTEFLAADIRKLIGAGSHRLS